MRGKVECVLVAPEEGQIISKETEKIKAIKGHGIKGDRHAGTRLADAREKELRSFGIPKGVEIANFREFSAVSTEEISEISSSMGLSGVIPPGSLGENIIVSGIPYFTKLPIGTLLFFQKNEHTKRTAVLVVWEENMPCRLPGEVIQQHFSDIPDLASSFPKNAKGKRGVVGAVYCSGVIHKGDEVIVKIPPRDFFW